MKQILNGLEYSLEGIGKDPVMRSIFCMIKTEREKKIAAGQDKQEVDKLFIIAVERLKAGKINNCEKCSASMLLFDFLKDPLRATCHDDKTCEKNMTAARNMKLKIELISKASVLLNSIKDQIPDAPLGVYRGGDGIESEGSLVTYSDNMLRAIQKDAAINTINECIRAIEKLEDGTYGECDECESHIPKVRMNLHPHSVLCTKCKSAEEEQRKKTPPCRTIGANTGIDMQCLQRQIHDLSRVTPLKQ